jgi:hypothetical protein
MEQNRRDRVVSWILGAIAGISIGVSVLDVIGVWPGWAARLTPFFVGVLLLYVVLERERVEGIKFIVRRLDKGISRLAGDVRQNTAVQAGNQLAQPRRSILYKGMIFRSNTEVRIAKALDRAEVFYLPPTRARLTIGRERQSREVDFLIFHAGRWGMLEVDGPFHTAANDAARDAHMRANGISVIHRYDSERCFHAPQDVVADFLQRITTVPDTPSPQPFR